MAPPPPLRGPWQWLKSLATPRDKLVLALGVAAALVSGAWTTRVGVAVSLALGAFVTTPVDATAVSTAVRDLQWLACGLFVVETVAWLAFKHVAAKSAKAMGVDTRRRLQIRDEDGGSRSVRSEPRVRGMEEAVEGRFAPALLAFSRNVALLVTALALALSRCDEARDVSYVVLQVAYCGGLAVFLLTTKVIPDPTDSANTIFAKTNLSKMRPIATHNAQGMVSAALSGRAQKSGVNDVLQTFLSCSPSGVSLSAACMALSSLIVFWAKVFVKHSEAPPREAFEAASGALLASAALLLVLRHWQMIVETTDVIHKTTGFMPSNNPDPSSIGSGDAITMRSVFQLLQPDRRVMLVGVVGSAAGVMIARVATSAIVAQLIACTASANATATDYHPACQVELDSHLPFDFHEIVAMSLCIFLSVCSWRLIGAKLYRRVLSLHTEAVFHQSVRHVESPGSDADAFQATHASLPSDVSSVCRSPAVAMIYIFATLGALGTFFTSRSAAMAGSLLAMATPSLAISWTYRKHRVVSSFVDVLQGPLIASAAFARAMIPAIVFSYDSQLIGEGLSPSFADIVAPLVAISLALAAAEMVTSQTDVFLEDWKRTVNACQVIIELRALMVKSTHNQKTQRTKPLGTIQFQNVCFQDPVKKNISPLKQLSLTINAGETVVFCGPSGAGHEHVVTLLERFYDPASGDVLMDDENLKDVDTVWLREQIGLLSTDPILFEGSVSDNISVGCGRVATQEEIEDAAKVANAHEFILENLADAYESKVTPAETYTKVFGIGLNVIDHRMMSVPTKNGSTAPRNTHRSIAFARMFLKDPAVLVLDEPTKDDPFTDLKVVRQSIDTLLASKKRTTIIIGHELPNVRSADRIYVLNAGEIAEQGTHEQLIAKEGGVYHSLVN